MNSPPSYRRRLNYRQCNPRGAITRIRAPGTPGIITVTFQYHIPISDANDLAQGTPNNEELSEVSEAAAGYGTLHDIGPAAINNQMPDFHANLHSNSSAAELAYTDVPNGFPVDFALMNSVASYPSNFDSVNNNFLNLDSTKDARSLEFPIESPGLSIINPGPLGKQLRLGHHNRSQSSNLNSRTRSSSQFMEQSNPQNELMDQVENNFQVLPPRVYHQQLHRQLPYHPENQSLNDEFLLPGCVQGQALQLRAGHKRRRTVQLPPDPFVSFSRSAVQQPKQIHSTQFQSIQARRQASYHTRHPMSMPAYSEGCDMQQANALLEIHHSALALHNASQQSLQDYPFIPSTTPEDFSGHISMPNSPFYLTNPTQFSPLPSPFFQPPNLQRLIPRSHPSPTFQQPQSVASSSSSSVLQNLEHPNPATRNALFGDPLPPASHSRSLTPMSAEDFNPIGESPSEISFSNPQIQPSVPAMVQPQSQNLHPFYPHFRTLLCHPPLPVSELPQARLTPTSAPVATFHTTTLPLPFVAPLSSYQSLLLRAINRFVCGTHPSPQSHFLTNLADFKIFTSAKITIEIWGEEPDVPETADTLLLRKRKRELGIVTEGGGTYRSGKEKEKENLKKLGWGGWMGWKGRRLGLDGNGGWEAAGLEDKGIGEEGEHGEHREEMNASTDADADWESREHEMGEVALGEEREEEQQEEESVEENDDRSKGKKRDKGKEREKDTKERWEMEDLEAMTREEWISIGLRLQRMEGLRLGRVIVFVE